jgi:hypothetical protein
MTHAMRIGISLLLAVFVHAGVAQQPTLDEAAAREAVYRIVRHSGLVPNFVVRASSETRTAIAYVKDKQRVIAYNPQFMATVLDSARSDWSAISILAHEVAHHLLGHTIDPASLRPGDELACDRYSGFVLFGMGAALAEALSAQSAIGDPHGTRRHPPKHARLEAIRHGWDEARRLREGLPPESPRDPDGLQYVLSFVDDANTYYADSLGRVVWFDQSACAIPFGELRDGGKAGFTLQWMDESFVIDNRMAIWRKSAHGMPLQVGRMERYAR